jgi:uncharacterized damage-inducible protein DinB
MEPQRSADPDRRKLTRPGGEVDDPAAMSSAARMSRPEAWLRGPIDGVDPYLLPVAHALVQATEDLERAASPLTAAEVWIRPGGAASVGFHLRHLVGSLDRLLTYSRGEGLSDEQRRELQREAETGDPPAEAAELIEQVGAAVEKALQQLRSTPRAALLEPRGVGARQLPSTVLGLLFHAAEHTQRHVGQVITTARIVQGLGLTEGKGTAEA